MTKTLQIAIVRADRSDLAIGLDQQDPWRCETKGPDKAVDYSNSSGLAQRKEQSDTQHQTIERS